MEQKRGQEVNVNEEKYKKLDYECTTMSFVEKDDDVLVIGTISSMSELLIKCVHFGSTLFQSRF